MLRYPPRLLEYAARQVEAITTIGRLVDLSFDVNFSAKDRDQYGHFCLNIDTLLAGDKWSFLNSISFPNSTSFFLFPKLYKIGALKVVQHNLDYRCV